MSTDELPDPISTYLRAHDISDADTALATFIPGATVVDDGQTYTGTERIRSWLTHAASEFTYTRTITGVERLGDDAYIVHNHLAGDFPGGEVDLHYRFEVRDGLIDRLDIFP